MEDFITMMRTTIQASSIFTTTIVFFTISLILGLIPVVNFGTAIFLLTHILPALSKSRPTPMENMPAG